MGVRGLQTYIEKDCRDACSRVSIEDLSETYRRETGKDPVIVVDVSSCTRFFYGKLEWIYGGQLYQFSEVMHKFVQSFSKIGIKLVMFFDGAPVDTKRNVWITRRLGQLEKTCIVFDYVKMGNVHRVLGSDDYYHMPPGLTFVAKTVFRHYPNCELHTSILEADEEIADYARTKQCFAILGQDTDYVIFKGAQYYFTVKNLNLDNMTTLHYDREILSQKLNIDVDHLPVFATLCGNDIVPADDLKDFHRRLCRNIRYSGSWIPLKLKFQQVAAYVRKLPAGYGIEDCLPDVSKFVFGNESYAKKLQTSIESYLWKKKLPGKKPQNPWEELIELATKRHSQSLTAGYVIAIMTGKAFDLNPSIEDYRNKQMPHSARILKPIRQYTYGVLLKQKPGITENPVVEEWAVYDPSSLQEPAVVSIRFPTAAHPGLKYLWESQDPESCDIRWKLFCDGISPLVPVDRIKSLEQRLVFPTLVMFYLYHEVKPSFLKEFEVEAIISHCVSMSTKTGEDLRRLECCELDPRVMQLAATFLKSVNHLHFLNGVCGFVVPDNLTCPVHYFDGKLFHNYYQKVKNNTPAVTLCGKEVQQIEAYNAIVSIILQQSSHKASVSQ